MVKFSEVRKNFRRGKISTRLCLVYYRNGKLTLATIMCVIQLFIIFWMIKVKIQDICSHSVVFFRNFQYEHNFSLLVLPNVRTKKLSESPQQENGLTHSG